MKLMVLDGNSIVNRAFYGIKLLSTHSGQYTNAIYGFLSILFKLLDGDSPDALCVAFDRKAPTFRHQSYDAYKANRRPMPAELAQQMPVLKQILAAMKIPCYEQDGWEADDLIGTISRCCERAGWTCVAVTGDKDALQLITDRTTVKLVTTRMGQTTTRDMTPESFQAEYGFAPPLLIDLKALMGDPSDNYPGVKGIGEKTAMSLIRDYGSVQHLYEHLEELPLRPAQRRRLEAGRDDARLSYDLATIRCDAPMDFSPEANLRQEPDQAALYELFRQLEFYKFIERFGLAPAPDAPAPSTAPEAEPALAVPESDGQIDPLLEAWRGADWVAVLPLDSLSGVTAVTDSHQGALLLRSHLSESAFRHALEVLFSAQVRKVAHQVKELMNLLLSQDLSTEGFLFDTALGAYLLDPTAGSYELDRLCEHYCALRLPPFQPEDCSALFQRADGIGALYRAMRPKLEEYGMMDLYQSVELPLCAVLAEMERSGFLIDQDALQQFGSMLSERITDAQRDIYALSGLEFNINSTKQLGEVLFETLGLPAHKKTKRGYSTSAEVLEKLCGAHPIIDRLLQFRQLSKLKSTYVDGLTRVIAPDGRIHTSFQNTVTATGRLSSAEPNLQNIPVRTPLGAQMREMFIASPGNVLVDADYSQIELRLLAHIAGDERMIQHFQSGVDIHTVTASQVFGVPLELVTRQMRSSAKAVNFGIVYGISEFSLAQDIGVTRAEAHDYMQRYFQTYAGVRAYQKQVVEDARQNGYAVTPLGRRRWLPELKSTNFTIRSFGERVALNMPVQGAAADIIKLAMVRVRDRLRSEGLSGKLVLQVHDELIVECPEAEGPRVAQILEEEMEHVVSLRVPLVAEAKIGACWADAH